MYIMQFWVVVQFFEFKPVPYDEVERAVKRAFSILADENGISVEIDDKTVKTISVACGGDVRKAMNSAELSF